MVLIEGGVAMRSARCTANAGRKVHGVEGAISHPSVTCCRIVSVLVHMRSGGLTYSLGYDRRIGLSGFHAHSARRGGHHHQRRDWQSHTQAPSGDGRAERREESREVGPPSRSSGSRESFEGRHTDRTNGLG